jgi:site-specific recombinase XerD
MSLLCAAPQKESSPLLVPSTASAADRSPLPTALLQAAENYARDEKAAATQQAYRTDFTIFATWCSTHGVAALPANAETIAAFLAYEADSGKRRSTIGRRLAAIQCAHQLRSITPLPTKDPRVRATLRGIRRSLEKTPLKKAPVTAERVVVMAPTPDHRLSTLRDRALLLVGFASALRRSELIALDVDDVEEVAEGLRLTIRKSKTDQERRGVVIALPRGAQACPVAALKAWLDASGIRQGPLFRPIAKGNHIQPTRLTDHSVAKIVKTHAARIGLDPKQFGAHSLRCGFLTSAATKGASLLKMADQSRHKSLDSLRGYIREAEIFKRHAGADLL